MITCLEMLGEKTIEDCPHCGQTTKRVWGILSEDHKESVLYYAAWHPTPSDEPARFDFVVQHQNEAGVGRYAVSLLFRYDEESFGCMVVDGNPDLQSSKLTDHIFTRAETLAYPGLK